MAQFALNTCGMPLPHKTAQYYLRYVKVVSTTYGNGETLPVTVGEYQMISGRISTLGEVDAVHGIELCGLQVFKHGYGISLDLMDLGIWICLVRFQ